MAMFIQKPWYRKGGSGGWIYGVEWDGSSNPTWTRTDDAVGFVDPNPAVNNGNGSSPFDEIMPWAGMQIVEDSNAGTLVEIPKFYYKWTRNGASMKLQISDTQFDGSFVSPAHADRGDGSGERDYVYVGRYHCANDSFYKYRSIATKTIVTQTYKLEPLSNETRDGFRSGVHNLGSNVWQWDYAMYWTIMMLYLVEYGDWNSQAKIGYGCGNNSGKENMGSTDGMTYHTGTNVSSRTTYGHTQYRHIEDLWGNVRDWCDGIYFSGADVYCIKNPSAFSDSTGGTKVGTKSTDEYAGFIKAWNTPSTNGFEYALYPSDHSASEGTYVCDYCGDSTGVVLCVGGYYNRSQQCGAFYLLAITASSSFGSVGSRLMVLPPSRLS